MDSALLDSKQRSSISLAFAGGEGHRTILSIIWNELFPFFSSADILPCRLVCHEFKDTIAQYPWKDIYTTVIGRTDLWKKCFPSAKAINLNQAYRRRLVRDEDISHLRGLNYINISYCHHITDKAFEFLEDYKCIIMNNCPQITNKAFKHLIGIKRLEMSYCPRITTTAFYYLKGIKYLNLIDCQKINDSAFRHLKGIIELNIACCKQLSDKAFVHLDGIRALNMMRCNQNTITPEIFNHLKGIQFLIMNECSDELISEAKYLRLNVYDNWSNQTIRLMRVKESETLILKKIY
jgi:hypothetical protein